MRFTLTCESKLDILCLLFYLVGIAAINALCIKYTHKKTKVNSKNQKNVKNVVICSLSIDKGERSVYFITYQYVIMEKD